MNAATTTGAVPANRLDRRKAHTAGRHLSTPLCSSSPRAGDNRRVSRRSPTRPTSASGPSTTTSPARSNCSRRASEEVLERWAQMIDAACAGLRDPAEVFAVSLRLSGRLAWPPRHRRLHHRHGPGARRRTPWPGTPCAS